MLLMKEMSTCREGSFSGEGKISGEEEISGEGELFWRGRDLWRKWRDFSARERFPDKNGDLFRRKVRESDEGEISRRKWRPFLGKSERESDENERESN
jgi:hypothetical protein